MISVNYLVVAGALLTLLFSSCGNNGKPKEEITRTDTLQADPSISKLENLFKTGLQLPFSVDSALIAKQHFADSIGTGEMKLLAKNFLKHEQLGSLEYDLPDYYKIDSIKATGTYTTWCETLDIAMTKYSAANAIATIPFNADTKLLVWALRQSSYEACPWSSFTSIYLTVLYKNRIGQTAVIGEDFGAGDAPVSMHRSIYSKVNADGSIIMDWQEEHDDADTTFSELEKRTYVLNIKDSVIVVSKETKEKPIQVPHPKEDTN